MLLSGLQVMITGAAQGIGAAIARAAAREGAALILLGRQRSALEALAAELHQSVKSTVQLFEVDVTDAEGMTQVFRQLQQQGIQLDVLVNNAGMMKDAPLAMTRLIDAEAQWRVNTLAPLLASQLAARSMMRKRQGAIINLASWVGEQGSAGQAAYAASKAGVSSLTKSLAQELGPLGIRVNAVAPGFIETALTAGYQAEQRQRLQEHTALRRLGQAHEVAELVVFLASERASFITGQVIGIDGGMRL